MRFLDLSRRPRVLVVAHGHPYERDAFMAMFDSFPDVETFIVEHPVAPYALNPRALKDVDAIVLYDMPGGRPHEGPGYYVDPPEEFKAGFKALLAEGMPIVALHHAIGGWPGWDEYSEILGGKLIHVPDTVRGKALSDGGYRGGVTYNLSAVDATHPIFKDLPPSFEIEDELYLFDVFEDSIEPLLTSDYPAVSENFYSLAEAFQGRLNSSAGWSRPPGSQIVGWTKKADNSPIVYLQAGHGPTAFANRNYQRLLYNSIQWAVGQSPGGA